MSTYDIYLLISQDGSENFGIPGFQIDNILNVGTEAFGIKKEETKIIEAKFKAKTQIILETSVLEDFNGYYMIIKIKKN